MKRKIRTGLLLLLACLLLAFLCACQAEPQTPELPSEPEPQPEPEPEPEEEAAPCPTEEEARLMLEAALQETQALAEPEQAVQVGAVLEELYQVGYLAAPAEFDEAHRIYSYQTADGALYGIALQPFSDTLNGTSGEEADKNQNVPKRAKLMMDLSGQDLQVHILNMFENMPFRSEYYDALQSLWTDMGMEVIQQRDVTIDDLASLDACDVLIFAGHGTTFLAQPVMYTTEPVTEEADLRYSQYLFRDYSVGRILVEGSGWRYAVLPAFFRSHYGEGALQDTVVYSESSAFFGCDCYSAGQDDSMANAFLNASAKAVIGYHNNVDGCYSQNVMEYVLTEMMMCVGVSDAVDSAMKLYGADDGWKDEQIDKYPAYPVFRGAEDAVLLEIDPSPLRMSYLPGEPLVADFDGDGIDDSLLCEADYREATVTVVTSSGGEIQFTRQTPAAVGDIICCDLGTGRKAITVTLFTGLEGGNGAFYTHVYLWENGQYRCIMEQFPNDGFSGTVSSDGASFLIRTELGADYAGVMDNHSKFFAGTELNVDPVSNVEWQYNEETGAYDLVASYLIWPIGAHMFTTAYGNTRFALQDGVLVPVEQWVTQPEIE